MLVRALLQRRQLLWSALGRSPPSRLTRVRGDTTVHVQGLPPKRDAPPIRDDPHALTHAQIARKLDVGPIKPIRGPRAALLGLGTDGFDGGTGRAAVPATGSLECDTVAVTDKDQVPDAPLGAGATGTPSTARAGVHNTWAPLFPFAPSSPLGTLLATLLGRAVLRCCDPQYHDPPRITSLFDVVCIAVDDAARRAATASRNSALSDVSRAFIPGMRWGGGESHRAASFRAARYKLYVPSRRVTRVACHDAACSCRRTVGNVLTCDTRALLQVSTWSVEG